MNPTRLARFGRWTFLAGWAAGSTFVTLARIFDWPGWLCAVVAVGCGFAMQHAMDAIADRMAGPEAGRCGRSMEAGFGGGPLVCALPAGHAGWHRDENRAEWGPINQEMP